MKRMEKNTENIKYRIQILVNGTILTYNNCSIISDDSSWFVFSDKFNITYKYNRDLIISMVEIK